MVCKKSSLPIKSFTSAPSRTLSSLFRIFSMLTKSVCSVWVFAMP